MLRIAFYFLGFLLCACNANNKRASGSDKNVAKQASLNPASTEFKMTARYNSFDTTVEVLFWDTKDSISEVQKKNYDGFVSKQDSLTPEILKAIFDYYKSSYKAYKSGWTMSSGIPDSELVKYLPPPSTPEKLKSFITPALIHIQSKEACKEGTIGIEFDCSWDIENGLGVLINNWKVVRVSTAEVSYF